MKIMYPEKHGTPTVTSEDANYPIANLLDDRRRKVWKAANGVQIAILRVPITANAEAIALHKTNAETAICTITLDSSEQTLNAAAATDEGGGLVGIPLTGHGYIEGNIILLNDTTNYDGVHTLPSQAAGNANKIIITATYQAETFAGTETACIVIESTTHTLETATRTYDRFWQEYTAQSAAHTATIKLTAGTGETIEAGVVRAGVLVDFPDPRYGIGESRKSFTIKRQYPTGGWYIKTLGSIRIFTCTLRLTRSTEFYNLADVYEYYLENPMSILLLEGIDDLQYSVFAQMLDPFDGKHDYITKSDMNITFHEAA